MRINEIKGEDLKSIGFSEGKVIGIALDVIVQSFAGVAKDEVLHILGKVNQHPEEFVTDEVLGIIAREIIEMLNEDKLIDLKEVGDTYSIFGSDQIEQGAKSQMDVAMRLPVTVAGALMPDAHQGYGLPIGGVLATKNSIIPYGVGVDIGCRMALSIYDVSESHFFENETKYKRELIAWTKFGAGAGWQNKFRAEHAILDRPEFNMTPFIKNLQVKAHEQLGTSGGGNHFVEFGIIEFEQDDKVLNMSKGKYLALLTHSGSRGFGATIAGHYTRLAKEICRLPKEAANLAYLDLN